jgi:anti-sigma factor RsiW
VRDCRRIDVFLALYASDHLAEEEQRAFERHLNQCPLCAAEVEAYLKTIRLARLLPPEPLPRTLALRLAEVLERVKGQSARGWELPGEL